MTIDISIIIPTYNRLKDLKITLNSLIRQKKSPLEVIIIDQSESKYVFNYLKELKTHFKIKYFYSGVKSSCVARNIGIKNSCGDIITFLDDDVTLDNSYLSGLLDTFKNKKIMGVQGYIKNNYSFFCKLKKYFLRFIGFFTLISSKSGFVSPAFYSSYYISKPQKILTCQWLSGCNMSYRSILFKKYGFLFDDKLTRYCLGEDLDLSYRINKLFNGSLVINPKLLLSHRVSSNSRISDLCKIKMGFSYHSYLYFKNKKFNFGIYFWSLIWFLFYNLFVSLILLDFKSFINYIKGFLFLLSNLKQIYKLNLATVNYKLFGKV